MKQVCGIAVKTAQLISCLHLGSVSLCLIGTKGFGVPGPCER